MSKLTGRDSPNKHGSTGKLNKKLGSMAQLAQVFSVAPAVGGAGGPVRIKDTEEYWQKTLSLRNTSIALEDILQVCSCVLNFMSGLLHISGTG